MRRVPETYLPHADRDTVAACTHLEGLFRKLGLPVALVATFALAEIVQVDAA